MDVGVLGPISVTAPTPTELTRRDRVVLALLVLHLGRPLSTSQLADGMWGAKPPASSAKVVHGCVGRLRAALGRDVVETTPQGYRLCLGRDDIDAHRFEAAVARARRLAGVGEHDRAAYALTEGLDLWRGGAYEEVAHLEVAVIEAARLDEMRLQAEELRLDAWLRAGEHQESLAEAQAMSLAHPLRERRWTLLALAQYRSGQQQDALASLRRCRDMLCDEFGLDASSELDTLERAILTHDVSLATSAVRVSPSPTCPWPGLAAYDVADAEAFFGREADIEAATSILRRCGVLAVAGPSGVGKSSLVRAGVTARYLADGPPARVLAPGGHPLASLVALDLSPTDLLVVDQCEELFALCHDATEEDAFVDALADHAAGGPLALTVRADRLAEIAVRPRLARLVERGLYLLGPLDESGLRAVIERPAAMSALLVEPGLVDLLILELAGEPGALPLLSHALQETWARREGRTLTVAGHRASGGVRGAIAQSAEEVYRGLDASEQQAFREMMLRLVTAGVESQPVRVPVPRSLIATSPAHHRVIDRLASARLVTTDEGVVTLAHEALTRAWPRLRTWLDEDADGRRILHDISTGAETWDALGRHDSELFRGARLAQALEWRHGGSIALSEREDAFIDAAQGLADEELRREDERRRRQVRVNRQLRGLSLALGVLVVAALVAATLAVRQSHRADRSALSADAGRVGARALVTDDVTRSLLLAVAGARLDPSTEERRNLDAALARYPELVRSTTVPSRSNLGGLDASPDGQTVAVVDDSHHLWSLDSRTLRPLADVQLGDSRPASADTPLAFSPTGDVLAVGAPSSARHAALLLDPRTLSPLRVQLPGWPSRPSRVIGIRFSPDGRFLAVSLNQPADLPGGTAPDHQRGARGVALVWDVSAPGRPLVGRVRLTADPYYAEAAPSSDGRTLYVAWPLSAYHLPHGTLEFRRPATSSIEVALDPGGRLLASPTFDAADEVLLADARTGRPVRRLRGHTGDVLQVAFSDDGSLLAATSRDGRVLVWDVTTGDVVHDISVGTEAATGVAFGPGARTLYTTAADSHEIHAWDLSGEHRFVARVPLRHPREVSSAFIRPSPDAGIVATMQNAGDAAPELRFVDLSTGRATRRSKTRTGAPWAGAGSWRPDGARYAVAYGDGWVQVFAPGERRPIVQRHVLDAFWIELAYTPDGRRLAAVSDDGRVAVLDANTLRPLMRPIQLPGHGWEISVAPDGHTAFVTGSEDSSDPTYAHPVDRWWLVDLADRSIVRQGRLDLADSTYTAFSPRGDRVAVAGTGGLVEVLNTDTGRPVTAPAVGHRGDVYWVEFSPDGSEIASGSNAGDVSLWDGRTGALLSSTRLPGPERVAVAGFRPDGTLSVASFTGEAYHWDPSLGHAIAFACAAAGRDLTTQEWHDELPDRPPRPVCPGAR